MEKKIWLYLLLIGCGVNIQTMIERETPYKFQKKSTKKTRTRKNKKKALKDPRYERHSGTNDLSQPAVELRETFDLENTTPREEQTTQFQEYSTNH